MPEQNETLPSETPAKKREKRLLLAVVEYYVELPTHKQILVSLLFSMLCAIGFQVIHGFDLLCKYSGGYVCIATQLPKFDTTGFQKRRSDNEIFKDSVLTVLGKLSLLPSTVKRMDDKQTRLIGYFRHLPGAPGAIRAWKIDSARGMQDDDGLGSKAFFEPSEVAAGGLASNSPEDFQSRLDYCRDNPASESCKMNPPTRSKQ